jgi:hypothetical protein
VTGVGRPVAEMVAEQVSGNGRVKLYFVTFTYGDKRIVDPDSGEIRLGKAWVVSRLTALFESGRLVLPSDSLVARQMMKELQDYDTKVDLEGNEKYGAFKVGQHDDLVTALGLATQEIPERHYGYQFNWA